MTLELYIRTTDEPDVSPWLLDGEAVDSQHPAQFVVGAVDHVLLLLIVQLLLDDVLAQVEHHLQGEHRSCIMGDETCRGFGVAGAPPYLLHGENVLGGSSVSKQMVELHFGSDLGLQTGSSQSAKRETVTESTVRQEVGITHQLVVIRGARAELSVSRHDGDPAESKQTPFNLKQQNNNNNNNNTLAREPGTSAGRFIPLQMKINRKSLCG